MTQVLIRVAENVSIKEKSPLGKAGLISSIISKLSNFSLEHKRNQKSFSQKYSLIIQKAYPHSKGMELRRLSKVIDEYTRISEDNYYSTLGKLLNRAAFFGYRPPHFFGGHHV